LRIRLLLLCLTLGVAGMHAAALHAEPRVLDPDDYYQFLDVTDPQASPDGTAIAYVVSNNDRAADAAKSTIWLVNWDGSERRPLTQADSASRPRFSPDGRYLSFLSARPADSAAQVWLLDRRGGEARQLTHTTGEISSYSWSPDGRQLVLVMSKAEASAAKVPKPIVIDDYHFKADELGYLNTATHKHLYLVDVANGAETAVTTADEYDDDDATWAPDGKLLAYVSNHSKDAERSGVEEIYLIEPRAGATPRKLTAAYSPNSQHIAFSPDGRFVSFLQGREPKYNAYLADRLAMVSVATGDVRPLTDHLDQQVSSPAFSADGSAIDFIVEDHGSAYEARLTLATGRIARISPDTITVLGQSSAGGRTLILGSTDTQPPELFALEAGGVRPLTAHNEALLADLKLGAVQDIHFKSRDGTEIQGQIVKPPSYVAGRRYPTILWIHGGPNGQDQHELISKGYSPSLERQLFAARGYVVLAVNYRGSTGRGQKFQQSILADWGHKEVEDLLAAVDYAVALGLADPAKLGIGGWSYGAILTDYTIASDPRFKAAISGAGSGDQIGMYGLDQYALQYNAELSPPWKNSALYLKLSYPFFHADRIHTPTLFLGGDKDFNVPVAGGEQMYLALRTLGVPTELVVYPGQFHVLTRPSFLKDRAERYLAWYAKYIH
jgi:dipeptidyl aminopeptidase/acylaminoacyl peptidase